MKNLNIYILTSFLFCSINMGAYGQQKTTLLVPKLTTAKPIGFSQKRFLRVMVNPTKTKSLNSAVPNQLVVLIPFGYTSKDVLYAFQNALPSLNISIARECNCGDQLVLLQGNGLESVRVSLSPGNGEACPNETKSCESGEKIDKALPFKPQNEMVKDTTKRSISPFLNSRFPIKVAILDSGIDPNDEFIRRHRGAFYLNDSGSILGINVVENGGEMSANILKTQ